MSTARVNYDAFVDFLKDNPEEIALELIQLERDLGELVNLDSHYRQSDGSWIEKAARQRLTYRWETPPTASSSSSSPAAPGADALKSDYQAKILHVRKKIHEYDEAVRDFAFLESMRSPSKSNLKNIQTWLARKDFSNHFLVKSEQDIWTSATGTGDFLAFSPDSAFSAAIGRIIIAVRQLFSKRGTPGQLFKVDSSESSAIAQSLSIIIASVMPVLPIVVLFFVHRLLVRIGLVLVFTAIFGAVLVFGLEMRADQVLAVTTAIAAIQVVYVGSTGASTG